MTKDKTKRKCEDCRAFQPEVYIKELNVSLHKTRCQYNQKLGSAPTCACYCETVEEHLEISSKRYHS